MTQRIKRKDSLFRHVEMVIQRITRMETLLPCACKQCVSPIHTSHLVFEIPIKVVAKSPLEKEKYADWRKTEL
jgi:hypothetical protein